MNPFTVRRTVVAALAAALVATVGAAAAPTPSGASPTPPAPGAATHTAIDWQRTAVRTVYTEGGSAPPVGSFYLAFTSLAVRDAVHHSLARHRSSEVAAIATAAHTVLASYFGGSQAALDADLDASLAEVPDGRAELKGIRIGRRAANAVIDSRVGDGRGDPAVVYDRAPAAGIWQAPATGMAAAWVGFVDPVVLERPVRLDGPDPLGSTAYAADYDEVRTVGRKTAGLDQRSAEQTAIAQFFTANPVAMYRTTLCRQLESDPVSLRTTVDLFALVDAATADTFIQSWRLKYDVAFWRPSQAIAAAADDGNPATAPETGWEPLIANPAYADYTSGHAAATSAFAASVRLVLGDETPLLLTGANGIQRSYADLSALEHDALNARIWSGLHFRDAMDDGYLLGHVTAFRVLRNLE